MTSDDQPNDIGLALAGRVAEHFAALPGVVAVVLAGSRVAGPALGLPPGPNADLDLYVYAEGEVALADRTTIARAFGPPDRAAVATTDAPSREPEIGNTFWEPGDEWRDHATGLGVDVMYRSPAWIADQLARVLDRHEASVGYSTCFWHNVRYSLPLADPTGWYAALQRRADQPYPDALRRAVLAQNLPVLRRIGSSFLAQLRGALDRDDPVAANHRLAALLASVFDVLFALNRVPHPGEKRLLPYAEALCPLRPPDFAARVRALLAAGADPDLLPLADRLRGDLEAVAVG